MSDYFDELETQAHDTRMRDLYQRLPAYLTAAVANCPGLANHLADIDLSRIDDQAALAELPLLRKQTLLEAQAANPPFGGFANEQALQGTRIFCSPGPIWEPQGPGIDPWQCARALYAAGVRRGDRVHNTFSYHATPGAFVIDEGARALGCLVYAAGTGNSEAQLQAIEAYRPQVFVGTPDYLKILQDKAAERGVDLSCITRALVSGGALFPALREEYQRRGVSVLQAYATAELGIVAYETRHAGELLPGMIVNENLIVEIVRPGTNTALPAGEVGELVVTNFNSSYPLVRFGTGDLSALLPGASPCGRSGLRIQGWMGRADQRTKVKGMFVDPKQVARIHRHHPELQRIKLVVGRHNDLDTLTLLVEGEHADIEAIGATLRSVTGLSGSVVHSHQPLPNDGVVVADEREYSASP